MRKVLNGLEVSISIYIQLERQQNITGGGGGGGGGHVMMVSTYVPTTFEVSISIRVDF